MRQDNRGDSLNIRQKFSPKIVLALLVGAGQCPQKGRLMVPTADPFGLERFVTAQTPIFDTVLAELKAGRKRGHWMWFIFPQLRGLGHSSMAQFYGVGSLDEAQAYLGHPLLGSRLTLCTEAVLTSSATSLKELFGSPDDLKFRSSMTLFATATADDRSQYQKALDRWCGGQADEQTLQLLSQGVES